MSISGLFGGGENYDNFHSRPEFRDVHVYSHSGRECGMLEGAAPREDSGKLLGATIRRLPLFSRCPITNEARMENPTEFADNRSSNRIPLNSISNVSLNIDPGRPGNSINMVAACLPAGGGGVGYPIAAHNQQVFNNNNTTNNLLSAQQQHIGLDFNNAALLQGCGGANNSNTAAAATNRMKTVRSPIHKPSLDEVKDNSLVALTNKFGKGKYWFKSASPTPDPRWSAEQQLMIGPIPGDVEYSQLRAAFLAQGHTLHLFIQNNQGWLEKNQEKFGPKHVKFGYVVYTERETARRLLHNGYVPVGTVRIRVKEMDGQPAVFL